MTGTLTWRKYVHCWTCRSLTYCACRWTDILLCNAEESGTIKYPPINRGIFYCYDRSPFPLRNIYHTIPNNTIISPPNTLIEIIREISDCPCIAKRRASTIYKIGFQRDTFCQNSGSADTA